MQTILLTYNIFGQKESDFFFFFYFDFKYI